MRKHTSGPWTAMQLDLHDDNILIAKCGKNGKIIAEIATVTWWGSEFEKKQNADAQLIAAAPDMLDYIEKVSAWTFAGMFLHKGLTYKKGINDTPALEVLKCLYLEIANKATGKMEVTNEM